MWEVQIRKTIRIKPTENEVSEPENLFGEPQPVRSTLEPLSLVSKLIGESSDPGTLRRKMPALPWSNNKEVSQDRGSVRGSKNRAHATVT